MDDLFVKSGMIKSEQPSSISLEPDCAYKDSSSYPSLWDILVSRTRLKYDVDFGHEHHIDHAKLCDILCSEVNILLKKVFGLFEECTIPDSNGAVEMRQPLSLCLSSSKNIILKFRLKEKLPANFSETLFSPLTDNFEMPIACTLSVTNEFLEQSDIKAETNDLDKEQQSTKRKQVAIKGLNYEVIQPQRKTRAKKNAKAKLFNCENCGKSWSDKKGIAYHKSKGKCSNEQRWIKWTRGRPICIHPDCLGKPDSEYTCASMFKHIMDEHATPDTSLIQCSDCPKTFPMTVILKHHQETAHQAFAKMCTICGKLFKDLRRHRLVHSGDRPFQCDKCEFRCARGSTLKRHMYTHSDSTEGRVHKCDLCEKAFYEAFTLKEHKLTHDKVKPFQCKLCSDVFSNYSGHRQHMMRAHGLKLTCEICEKDSYSLRGLNIHKRDHHGIPF